LRHFLMAAALVVAGGMAAPAGALELVLSAGEFDVEEEIGDGPYELGVTLRLDAIELARWSWGSIIPAFGVMANEDESYYGWGGFAFVIPLGDRWRVTPQLGAGAYEQGDGRNLGGTLEFRSGLELAVRPGARTWVGLEFYHLSNAGIHERNPGTNSLVVNVGFSP
jgi:hypothetical protein